MINSIEKIQHRELIQLHRVPEFLENVPRLDISNLVMRDIRISPVGFTRDVGIRRGGFVVGIVVRHGRLEIGMAFEEHLEIVLVNKAILVDIHDEAVLLDRFCVFEGLEEGLLDEFVEFLSRDSGVGAVAAAGLFEE